MEEIVGLLTLTGLSVVALAFVVFFLLLVLGLAVFFIFFLKSSHRFAQKQAAERTAWFSSLQEAHGGQLTESSYSPHPALQLSMGRDTAYLARNVVGGEHPRAHTDLFIEVPDALPRFSLTRQNVDLGLGSLLGLQDIQLGVPDFDKDFVIKGDAQAVPSLLDESVRGCVRALHASLQAMEGLRISSSPQVGSGTLLHIRRGQQRDVTSTSLYIEHAQQLVQALQCSTQRLWSEAASRYQLSLATADGLPLMRGELNGVPVEIAVRRSGKGHRTHITVSNAGPAGLHILHVDHSGPDAPQIRTNNPVLDMTVQIHGDDTDGILQLLGNDGCTDAILPIVHGYPGTAITDQGTVLELVGWQAQAMPELLEKLDKLTAHLPSP